MKKTTLIFFICLAFAMSLQASIYRVNNKLAKNVAAKIYTVIQDAVDEAANGDTIQIEGSQDVYASFECAKKLVIVGPGYFLFENPGVSGNQKSATVNNISLKVGAEGTIIMGLKDVSFTIYSDNITIRRCILSIINPFYPVNSISDLIVTECFCPGYTGSLFNMFNGSYAIENIVFTNNIILNEGINFSTNSTGIFANNIFKSNSNTLKIPSGFEIKNNIIISTGTTNITLPDLPRANICNNISSSTHFGTDNSNQANVNETNIFLGSATGSPDGKYQLKDGSPAKGAGEAGADIGAFGGPSPYALSGIPPGPVILEFSINTYSTSDNKISVKLKAKSN